VKRSVIFLIATGQSHRAIPD